MTVTEVRVASAQGTGTVSIVTPASGNLLLAEVRKNQGGGSAPTLPSGFTLAGMYGPSTGDGNFVGFAYKIADGTETSVTWGNMSGGSRRVTCFELSKSLGTWNVQETGETTDATMSASAGPITPAHTDGLGFFHTIWSSSLSETRTPAAGWTQRHDESFQGHLNSKASLTTSAETGGVSWPNLTRDVASGIVVVSDFSAGGSAVGDDLDLRWSVRDAVGDTADLRWSVRDIVGDTLDARWSVRDSIGENLDLRWAVRDAAGDTLDLRWSVEALPAQAVTQTRSSEALDPPPATSGFDRVPGRAYDPERTMPAMFIATQFRPNEV